MSLNDLTLGNGGSGGQAQSYVRIATDTTVTVTGALLLNSAGNDDMTINGGTIAAQGGITDESVAAPVSLEQAAKLRVETSPAEVSVAEVLEDIVAGRVLPT
jgi:hypothetical protein